MRPVTATLILSEPTVLMRVKDLIETFSDNVIQQPSWILAALNSWRPLFVRKTLFPVPYFRLRRREKRTPSHRQYILTIFFLLWSGGPVYLTVGRDPYR